jgi:predicted anti-sigma-YlaC factor YlaD
MNHQPYEEWIFSDSPDQNLSPQEVNALQNHLNECQSCRLLYDAWNELEQELVPTPIMAPEPGFTSRWQMHLQADRQKSHRRQTLLLLSISLVGALTLIGFMLSMVLPWIHTPSLFFWTWMYQLVKLFSIVSLATGVIGTLSSSVLNLIPVFGWVILAGLLSEIAVIWVVSYRLLLRTRRVS